MDSTMAMFTRSVSRKDEGFERSMVGILHLGRRVVSIVWGILSALVDWFPPYRHLSGLLEAKEKTEIMRHYVWVNSRRLQVDAYTYRLLNVGERIRLRHTRAQGRTQGRAHRPRSEHQGVVLLW